MKKKRLSILKILKDSGTPVPGSLITDELNRMGIEISERTVRFHLLEMDREGLTKSAGKQGRIITERGLEELSIARIYDKVGFSQPVLMICLPVHVITLLLVKAVSL